MAHSFQTQTRVEASQQACRFLVNLQETKSSSHWFLIWKILRRLSGLGPYIPNFKLCGTFSPIWVILGSKSKHSTWNFWELDLETVSSLPLTQQQNKLGPREGRDMLSWGRFGGKVLVSRLPVESATYLPYWGWHRPKLCFLISAVAATAAKKIEERESQLHVNSKQMTRAHCDRHSFPFGLDPSHDGVVS